MILLPLGNMLILVLLCLFPAPSLVREIWQPRQVSSHSKCRFSPLYSQDAIIHNSTDFEQDVIYWDGRFHQDNVGFSLFTGLTHDFRLLNISTGMALTNQSQVSNPSNEALHIMFLAQAIAGDPLAARFLYPDNLSGAAQFAGGILTAKLKMFLNFNHTFPGFAGFLPTFTAESNSIRPVNSWVGRASAVDNGKLVWAVYGLCQSLRQSNITEFRHLGNSWEMWLNYTKINAKGVFYRGTTAGNVCKVTTLKQSSLPYSSFQKYECEDSCNTNGPFEGELMVWFLHFSGMLNRTDKAALWEVKRSQLQAVNYTGAVSAPASCHETVDYSNALVSGRHIMPITVQKGLFFGSQETIKLLFLPHLDAPIVKQVFLNGEKVRTCNSWLMGNPGMYASTVNVTDLSDTVSKPSPVENAGIPLISFFKHQELDLVMPYSVFPTILFDRGIGLAWLKNMLDAQGVQTPYGSVAALRRDGTKIAALVDWQTRGPISLALLNGFVSLVRNAMKAQGIYDEFISITAQEYATVFDPKMNGGKTFMGEDIHFCLPNAKVPADGVEHYSGCE